MTGAIGRAVQLLELKSEEDSTEYCCPENVWKPSTMFWFVTPSELILSGAVIAKL
jgi:hypothetical protein